MKQTIDYWLPDHVAALLAHQYGQFLEHMPEDIKWLLINILSGVLHQIATTPGQEFTTAEYIGEKGIPEEQIAGLEETLAQLDQYDVSTISTVIMVLSMV